ncbi:MAG: Gfo/Idh/MocA family oxidoreductase [Bacteroidota bacterium]
MSGRVFHGPLLTSHPEFALTHVWQRSKSDAKDHYPEIEVVRTMEELLAAEVDLVVVNTPEPTHYAFTKAALEAGKHVVVEKAFTPTVAEAEELVALAREKGLLLSVFQNRRWDSDFLTVQQVIGQEMLGRLVEYESHYDRYRNYIQAGTWKEVEAPGTGILFNLGSHLIDQALVLFGMPEQVFADIRTQRTGGIVPDNFELILYYPELKATLKAGYLVREATPKYKLLGTDGSFLKYGLDTQEDALKAGSLPGGPTWGTEPEAQWGILNTQVGELHVRGQVESLAGNYLAYYDNIADVLLRSAPVAVPGEQGQQVIEVIEAAQRSAAEGKVVDMG